MDDMCTDLVDTKFGILTHKSCAKKYNIRPGKESKMFECLRKLYDHVLQSKSKFSIIRCDRYPGDGDSGAKIIATSDIPKGLVIKELAGNLCTVKNEWFWIKGRNDFSVVQTASSKQISRLWLGPAAYANHDCESNCLIYSLSKNSVCLRTNRKIFAGEEITIFYGAEYFGPQNEDCMCVSCEKKGEGKFLRQEPLTNIGHNYNVDNTLYCEHCPLKFLHKSWLARHMLKHYEKKFICPTCKKAFARRDNLRAHEITHDTQRASFKCSLCPSTFCWPTDVKKHMVVHTNKMIKCQKCPKAYKYKRDLMYHDNKGKAPFKCEVCGSNFHSPSARLKHFKLRH